MDKTRPVVGCLRCGLTFQQRRKDQKYCSRACQKANTHNAARGSRTTADSREKRYEKRRQWSTLRWMNETYYGTKPGERLGLIKDWLDLARVGDTHLRSVLRRPDFIQNADPDVCYLGDKGRPAVPYVAHKFCHRFLDCHIWDWVNGRAPEPDTGEVYDPSAIA